MYQANDFVEFRIVGVRLPVKGAHPCTSSSGQGGGKRVLEDFFKKSDNTVACSLGANREKV